MAIVGPQRKGTLPEGVTEIKSPTSLALVVGRIAARGKADVAAARASQKQWTLTPLSAWGKPGPPKYATGGQLTPFGVTGRVFNPWAPPPSPTVDPKTLPVALVASLDASAFFGRLLVLMKDNPAPAADAPMAETLKRLGLVPSKLASAAKAAKGALGLVAGALPDPTKMDPATLAMSATPMGMAARVGAGVGVGPAVLDMAARGGQVPPLPVAPPPPAAIDLTQLDEAVVSGLKRAVAAGQAKIIAALPDVGKAENGWKVVRDLGTYGTDYLKRAAVAFGGLGADLPQDVVCAYAEEDSDGQRLTGAARYVVHFDKGQTPPVDASWSLTIYDAHHALVANPLNRYCLGQGDDLKANDDGSLDIYIQTEPPQGKESNWLPAPEEEFNLVLRGYSPKAALTDGTWKPPAVRRLR